TLSLHDALPISRVEPLGAHRDLDAPVVTVEPLALARCEPELMRGRDARLGADFPHEVGSLLAPGRRLDDCRSVKKRGRRRGDLETIDAILARGGEDRFAPQKPPIPLALWRSTVGPRIADQAVPIALQREGPARV